mgnify:FL=1
MDTTALLKLNKLCILDLLIAIDEDVVDWRNYPKLWEAIRFADKTLDIWAGDNLKQIRDKLLEELNNG